jgi:hypothetical protein
MAIATASVHEHATQLRTRNFPSRMKAAWTFGGDKIGREEFFLFRALARKLL